MGRARCHPERSEGSARLALCATLGVALLAACAEPRSVNIAVDTSQTFQTMSGWEATAQAGSESPSYAHYRDTLIALAANDLQLNRVRLEVRSGVEHTRDYWREGQAGRLRGTDYRCGRYETLNDNDDPRVIDWKGFQFSELDLTVKTLVLPLQKAIAARGERMVLNVNYVSFFKQCPSGRRYDHRDAAEYAEFVLATTLHLRDTFGLVPDLWEIILEPDNTVDWGSQAVGRAIVATAARLRENGFVFRFVAPSNTAAEAAVRYYDGLRTVAGAGAEVEELGYHRYRWVTRWTLRDIAARGTRDGVRTAMLEHIGSGVDDLLDDLTIAQVSAWSQYALAYENEQDNGGLYYRIDETDPRHPVVREGSRTRFLRQVFRTARLGAVRIGATSDHRTARPVAFRNAAGPVGVAVRTTRAADISVAGLPAGRYAISSATEQRERDSLPDVVIAAGAAVHASIVAAGVVTLLAR